MATIEKLKRIKPHTQYRVNGKRVPGVTTILGILAKPALIHWAWDLGCQGVDYRKYRDKTATIGTLAHYLIECELSGEVPDLEPFSPEEIDKAENCLLKWYQWRDNNDLQPLLVEKALTSKIYKYGGTIDCYGFLNDNLALVDIKTSKAIYPEMVTQLAAYASLLTENGYTVDAVRIIRIGRTEDEGFEDYYKDKKELDPHWEKFYHCRQIYDLNKKIKKGG